MAISETGSLAVEGTASGPEAAGPAGHGVNAVLGGRVRIVQPASGYRSAIDPVLLAAFVPADATSRVMDLGCGVGTAALCLAARVPGALLTGLELDPERSRLARWSAEASGLSHRFEVLEGSVDALPRALTPRSFDHVMMNPPFLPADAATPSPDAGRRSATHEGDADLAVWIEAAARLLRPRGRLAIVHRADRFDSVVQALGARFGSITLLPLWPKSGEPARRVLIAAKLGGRSPATVLPGLVLHGPDGAFTPNAESVLRDAAALTD